MYTRLPAFVIGFHGCDKQVGDAIVAGKAVMKRSENSYDWLGSGYYFWEGNYHRALDYAKELARNPRRNGPKIKNPAVIGVVLDLGHCLNLLDHNALLLMRRSYELLRISCALSGEKMPVNKRVEGSTDLKLRNLDCAVIQMLHTMHKTDKTAVPYDSVRSVFFEGEELYPNAGFRQKNHIQICMRTETCMKGFFHPRVQAP